LEGHVCLENDPFPVDFPIYWNTGFHIFP
jgi:hypothetical protein